MRGGADREAARLRRGREGGCGAGQRRQPRRREAARCGRRRAGRESGCGNRAERHRLLDRRRAALRPRDRGARLHGSRPARLRVGLGRGRPPRFRFRDRSGPAARAERSHSRRPEGRMTLDEHVYSNLYLHIPFCKHKCGYCDFNAYAGMDRLMPDYVDALQRELAMARQLHPFATLETVYLGGGTPSLLPAELATRLLRYIRANFDVAKDAEITLEAHPASTDEAKLAAWLNGGVNRLSLRVQAVDGLPLS